MARQSWIYEFNSCALCHDVSHRELYANIPSLPFALGVVFFRSLPKIHDEVRDRKTDRFEPDSFAVLESSSFVITEQKNSRRIAFAVLELLQLLRCIAAHLQRTLPWVSGETQYLCLFTADFHSSLVALSRKAIKLILKFFFRRL